MNDDQGYKCVLVGGIKAMHITFKYVDDNCDTKLSGEEPKLIVNVTCPFKKVKLMAYALLQFHFW